MSPGVSSSQARRTTACACVRACVRASCCMHACMHIRRNGAQCVALIIATTTVWIFLRVGRIDTTHGTVHVNDMREWMEEKASFTLLSSLLVHTVHSHDQICIYLVYIRSYYSWNMVIACGWSTDLMILRDNGRSHKDFLSTFFFFLFY